MKQECWQWICGTLWKRQWAGGMWGKSAKANILRVGSSFFQIDLNQSLEGGSIAWTGPGTWTPDSQNTICVDFYGDQNNNCCCHLGQALTQEDGFKPLSNCHC